MIISQFQLNNYRSIVSSEVINLGKLTVLVGPNNEGKSNILRAMKSGLNILEGYRFYRVAMRGRRTSRYMRVYDAEVYDWKSDYPVSQQSKHPKGETTFTIEFQLNPDEIVEFKREINSSLNGALKFYIRIDSSNEPKIRIVKQGRGTENLNSKLDKVCHFISMRLAVDYVPAIRSSEDFQKEIRGELNKRMSSIEKDDKIQDAQKVIQGRYKELLSSYENELLDNIKSFIRNAKRVSLDFRENYSRFRPHDPRLMIDDGELTPLEAKGDGVQSLAVLSMKKASLEADDKRSHVLALEEPEAHLHPGAARRLADIISEISVHHQVVMTTHSPVLVRRANVEHNIIVRENRAKAAKNINEIRKSLGVELPDNLVSADTVLLVEGKTDVHVVGFLLSSRCSKLADSISSGQLVLESCEGASNVRYSLRRWRDDLCKVHVLLDGDKEGYKAKKLIIPELCDATDVTFISNSEYGSSMLEDLLNPEVFDHLIEEKYNVSLAVHRDCNTRKFLNFHARMDKCFADSGKDYDSSMESDVKKFLSDECCKMGERKDLLNPRFEPMVNNLVKTLLCKLYGDVC